MACRTSALKKQEKYTIKHPQSHPDPTDHFTNITATTKPGDKDEYHAGANSSLLVCRFFRYGRH